MSEILTEAFKSKFKPLIDYRDTGLNNSTQANRSKLARKVARNIKKRPSKIKQVPLKKLVSKATTVFSLWIRKRDGKCVTPDSLCKGVLQASHMIKSGRKYTKWDEHNVHTQCQHHNYNHDQGFHPSPEILTNYVVNKYGLKEYNRLCEEGKKDATSAWVREKALEIIKKYENKSSL